MGINHLSVGRWFLVGWPDQTSNFLLVSYMLDEGVAVREKNKPLTTEDKARN